MGYCIIKISIIIFLIKLEELNCNRENGRYTSNQRNIRRHIGGSAPPTDWEPGLREAANQALLRERHTGPNLRERLYSAPLMGRQYSATPFGDVAVLARGQLYTTPDGFMFVQDPYHNDCDDCRRRCDRSQCDTWKPRGFERLLALWTVKRIRHHDLRTGHYYELEYTISPISAAIPEAFITRNGGFDYSVPGHVFIVKPKNAPEDTYQSINQYETYDQKDYSNTDKSSSWSGFTPPSYSPPEHLPPPPPPINSADIYITGPFTTENPKQQPDDVKHGIYIGIGPSGIKHIVNSDLSYEKHTESRPDLNSPSPMMPEQSTSQTYDPKEIELLKNLLLQIALKTSTPGYNNPISLQPVTTSTSGDTTTTSYKFVPSPQTTTSHPGFQIPTVHSSSSKPPVLAPKPQTTLIPVDHSTFTKLQSGELIPIGFTTTELSHDMSLQHSSPSQPTNPSIKYPAFGTSILTQMPPKPTTHGASIEIYSSRPPSSPIYIQYSDNNKATAAPETSTPHSKPTRPTPALSPTTSVKPTTAPTKKQHPTNLHKVPSYSEEDEDVDVFSDENPPTTPKPQKKKGPNSQLPLPKRGSTTNPFTASTEHTSRRTTKTRQIKQGKKQFAQLVNDEQKISKTTPLHSSTSKLVTKLTPSEKTTISTTKQTKKLTTTKQSTTIPPSKQTETITTLKQTTTITTPKKTTITTPKQTTITTPKQTTITTSKQTTTTPKQITTTMLTTPKQRTTSKPTAFATEKQAKENIKLTSPTITMKSTAPVFATKTTNPEQDTITMPISSTQFVIPEQTTFYSSYTTNPTTLISTSSILTTTQNQDYTTQQTTPEDSSTKYTSTLQDAQFTMPQLISTIQITQMPKETTTQTTLQTAIPHITKYTIQETTSQNTVQEINTQNIKLFETKSTLPVSKQKTTTQKTTKKPTDGFLTKLDEYKPIKYKKPFLPNSKEEFDIFGDIDPQSSLPILSTKQYEKFKTANTPSLTTIIYQDKTEPFTTTSGPKIIYSNFYEASTAPSTTNVETSTTTHQSTQESTLPITIKDETTTAEKPTTIRDKTTSVIYETTKEKEPLTSQSYSTSISFEVNKVNKNKTESPKIETETIKAVVDEVNQSNSTVTIFKAEMPDSGFQKPLPLKITENNKAFDNIALSLANHARSIDYLNSKNIEHKEQKYKRRGYKPRGKRLRKKEPT